MRKLPPGQETQKLGINVKKTLKREFYALAEERGFGGLEGRFFEELFKEYKELKSTTETAGQKLRKVLKEHGIKSGDRVSVERFLTLLEGSQDQTGT